MRFLVTGCTGFIGIHLTRQLLAAGHQVVGLVRTPAKLPDDLRSQIDVLAGDLSLFRDPNLTLPEVDVIVHLAAVIAGKNAQEYADINYGAVCDLVDAVNRQAWTPKRFVFASSLAAAGPNRDGQVLDETMPLQPIDAYGIAKKKSEELLAAQPFATTCFRPPIVLGPGDPATFTLYKMARTGFAALPAGPPQQLSFVFVDDLCRAIVAMSTAEEPQHATYFATHERVVHNADLLHVMAGVFGRSMTIVHLPRPLLKLAMWVMTALAAVFRFRNQLDQKQYAQMTAPSFVCTSARLTAETGWRADVDFEEAIERSVTGYRKLGWL